MRGGERREERGEGRAIVEENGTSYGVFLRVLALLISILLPWVPCLWFGLLSIALLMSCYNILLASLLFHERRGYILVLWKAHGEKRKKNGNEVTRAR